MELVDKIACTDASYLSFQLKCNYIL